MLRELLTESWWTYHTQTTGGWGIAYRRFNLCDGAIWVSLGVLVLLRWRHHRRSRLEVAYGPTFILFGLPDFREASA
jgi:hypothetical protein